MVASEANEAICPEFGVARGTRLKLGGDGVYIGGVRRERNVGAASTRHLDHLLEQVMGALWPLPIDDGLECVEPLSCLKRVGVDRIVGGGQLAGHG